MEHAVRLNEDITRLDANIRIRKHIIVGVVAGLALPLVYVGVLSLAQGWEHALSQARPIWYWIVALAVGFGIQAGLFSFVKSGLRRHHTASASIATSGGSSTGSMAACCAHHLSEALPFLGLAGIAAFFIKYQMAFMILGLLSNAVGIIIMLEFIQRFELCPLVTRWSCDLGRVKKQAMFLSGLILVISFSVIFFNS